MIFFIYVSRSMSRFLCNVLFCLMIFLIIAFWLNVFTLFKRTSCVNTTYVLFIVVVDEIMLFINVKSRFIRVLIFLKLANNFRFSLNNRRIKSTFFFFFFIVINFCMRFLIYKCRINAFFFFVINFHHQRFFSFELRKNFLLFRFHDEFLTRILRFFSFFKALHFYCDRICIDVYFCFECIIVDSF